MKTILSLIALALSLQIQAQNAVVRLGHPSYAGNQVHIPLICENTPGVGSVSITLEYDTTVFQFDSSYGVHFIGPVTPIFMVNSLYNRFYYGAYSLNTFYVPDTLCTMVYGIKANGCGLYHFVNDSNSCYISLVNNVNVPTDYHDTTICSFSSGNASVNPGITLFFPNPAGEILYFNKAVGDARLFNLNGELASSATGSDRLDLTPLPAGIYFLNVEGVWRKIVKK